MFKKRVLPILLSLSLIASTTLTVAYAVETSGETEAEQTAPQTVNFTNAGPFLPVMLDEEPGTENNGLELDKTVTPNGDGNYTINLEAYTTGTVKVENKTKPVDIVLVLDVSGSMEDCINCSNGKHSGSCNNGQTEITYEPVYTISELGTYYYFNGQTYSRAYYCKGNRWSHQAGWYTERHFFGHGGNRLDPRTSADDAEGIQFYRQVETTVGGTTYESRMEALKTAVSTFLGNVQESAYGQDGRSGTDDDVEHRVALVKFAGNKNTEIGNGMYNDRTYNYSQQVTGLLDMSVSSSRTAIEGELNSITPGGATRADFGMEFADNILSRARNEADYDRNQVAILFTDGVPTSGSSFEDVVAGNAISKAANIKAYENATVYSVGVFTGANGTVPADLDALERLDDTNKYMHLVSSNLPDATGFEHYYKEYWWEKEEDQWGQLNDSLEEDESYYLSASDSESLEDIFETISDNISSETVDLGADSVIRDYVMPQFVMPDSPDDINVTIMDAAYDAGGNLTWQNGTLGTSGIDVTIDSNSKAVNVTGFDFKHNFVSPEGRKEQDQTQKGDFHGRKLVISFDVAVDPNFFGGNNVVTNGPGSGVYEDGNEVNPFEEFEFPEVNIPLRYEVPNTEETIFAGEAPNLNDESIDYDQNFVPDGFNNAYVNITYTLVAPDGTTVGVFEIPAGETAVEGTWTQGPTVGALYEDTVYTIQCAVEPKFDGKNAIGDTQGTLIDNDATHFVDVLNGQLTIHKKLAEGTNPDSGERFVFNIYKDGGSEPYMTVSVLAGDSVTINNLPKGEYRVEEDTTWSWRFDSDFEPDNATVIIDMNNPTGSVTCTNERTNEQWLNKYEWVVNHADDTTEGSEA